MDVIIHSFILERTEETHGNVSWTDQECAVVVCKISGFGRFVIEVFALILG
jgi:hypothetical protein